MASQSLMASSWPDTIRTHLSLYLNGEVLPRQYACVRVYVMAHFR